MGSLMVSHNPEDMDNIRRRTHIILIRHSFNPNLALYKILKYLNIAKTIINNQISLSPFNKLVLDISKYNSRVISKYNSSLVISKYNNRVISKVISKYNSLVISQYNNLLNNSFN